MVLRDRFSGPVTNAVVTAITDAKGVDPSELDPVLLDYIDVDALESLSAHEHSTWSLTFELPEHRVTVAGDLIVLVDGSLKKIWE